MMVTYMNFPGFYFFIAHRDTLQFFWIGTADRFFNSFIHFMQVISNDGDLSVKAIVLELL